MRIVDMSFGFSMMLLVLLWFDLSFQLRTTCLVWVFFSLFIRFDFNCWACSIVFLCWSLIGQSIWGCLFSSGFVTSKFSAACFPFLLLRLLVENMLRLEFTCLGWGPNWVTTLCMSLHNTIFIEWRCWPVEKEEERGIVFFSLEIMIDGVLCKALTLGFYWVLSKLIFLAILVVLDWEFSIVGWGRETVLFFTFISYFYWLRKFLFLLLPSSWFMRLPF